MFTALMIKQSGRSWWQAHYSDGRVLSEWDTMKLISPKTSRWEEAPKKGMTGLRILCPDGQAGELWGEKFFQLKVGGYEVGRGQYCDAHIIGVLTGIDGSCLCYAWETNEKRLVEFKDNVLCMNYRKIGPLGLANLGLN